MNKASVIIPTLYKKPKVLYKLVDLFLKDESVTEILIISNAKQIIDFPSSKKIRISTPEKNLYVNPSWNLGISLIKEDNFLISNDDILICEDFCNMVINSERFNKNNTGLIGIDNKRILQYHQTKDDLDIPNKRNPLFLEYTDFLDLKNWGSVFCGKKENYYTIPDIFKINFGDNYLVYKNMQNNKKIYSVSNLTFHHIKSSSSTMPEFSDILREDFNNAKKFFNK